MKKLVLAIFLVIIFTSSACSTANNSQGKKNTGAKNIGTSQSLGNTKQRVLRGEDIRNGGGVKGTFYRDGVYTALGDQTSYGNDKATVYVKGGKITRIVFARTDYSGKKVKYMGNAVDKGIGKKNIKIIDTRPSSNTVSKPVSPGYENKNPYMLSLEREIIRQQTYDVTIPNGSSIMVINGRLAVQRALQKAAK